MDHLSFQAYFIGRFIVQVLRGIPGDITRQSFLDELYTTRPRPDMHIIVEV